MIEITASEHHISGDGVMEIVLGSTQLIVAEGPNADTGQKLRHALAWNEQIQSFVLLTVDEQAKPVDITTVQAIDVIHQLLAARDLASEGST